MSYNQLDYDAIRKRADQRVKKRAGFFVHLAIWMAVMAFLWMIYFLTDAGDFPWPLIPMMGWGIGIVAHGASVFLDTGLLDNMREREFQREIAREMMRLGIDDPAELFEKPKREQAQSVRLSDDGELVPVDEEDERPRQSRRRG